MTAATLIVTKMVVADLDAASRFYQQVCGFAEAQRIEATLEGRAFVEAVMASPAKGGATLVLMAYRDGAPVAVGESVYGFNTEDAAAFLHRVRAAGGSVVEEPVTLAQLGLVVAFAKDPEGHVIEVMQRIARTAPSD